MTAVDELKIKLIFNSIVKEKRNGEVSFTIGLSKLDELINQAKEMEKEQIFNAFEIGYENGACVNENNDFYHGGNYYNETYKDKL